MPLRKISLKVAPEDAGKRLDQFLAERLPKALGRELSKAKVRKLIVAGAVYLNRIRVRIASKSLIVGATVEAMVDLQKLESAGGPAADRPFEMEERHVLYEDEFVIAVDKPAGLPTQATLDEARDNLYAVVRRFLSKRDGVAQPYLGLHHRLDRDTSGVVLFTKKTEANMGVAEAFSEHHARKTYVAVTHLPRGKIDKEWTVKNFLGKDPKARGKRARFTAVRSGGDFAHTDFRLLERFRQALFVEARPLTGRTHQIRVHLAEHGMPILADSHYGAGPSAGGIVAPRILLHAASLTFPHPIHKTEVTVESPLPEDFQKCLRLLRGASA